MERGPAREAAPSSQQVSSGTAEPRTTRTSDAPKAEQKTDQKADQKTDPRTLSEKTLSEKTLSEKTLSPGLEFPRYFTLPGVDPFDEVEWEIRSAVIGNEKGKVVFEQRDVEIPKAWSQQATNIVVSKYFRGQMASPEREHSVKQLIGRVVDTITAWARREQVLRQRGRAAVVHGTS